MKLLPFRDKESLAPLALSEQLQDMTHYGKPRLSMTGGGWYAVVDMNTNTTGTSFEVKSEFGHKTPDAAVAECLDRIHQTLKALGAI